MVVLPEHDAVVAMFSCVEKMQLVLDLMWQHLVPAMGPASTEPGVKEPEVTEPGVTEPGAADDDLRARLQSLVVPTAAQRLGGTPFAPMDLQLLPGVIGPQSHRTVTAIDISGDRLILREGEATVVVPMSTEWSTIVDAPIATSACSCPNGRIAVDLVMLDTPHRLELTLDPITSTFSSHWPVMPLFLAGLDNRLTAMRAPN